MRTLTLASLGLTHLNMKLFLGVYIGAGTRLQVYSFSNIFDEVPGEPKAVGSDVASRKALIGLQVSCQGIKAAHTKRQQSPKLFVSGHH